MEMADDGEDEEASSRRSPSKKSAPSISLETEMVVIVGMFLQSVDGYVFARSSCSCGRTSWPLLVKIDL